MSRVKDNLVTTGLSGKLGKQRVKLLMQGQYRLVEICCYRGVSSSGRRESDCIGIRLAGKRSNQGNGCLRHC